MNLDDKISIQKIENNDVLRYAKLSKFRFKQKAIEAFRDSFNDIMPNIGKLNLVDTVGVKPFTHDFDTTISEGKPDSNNDISVDEMLRNAPKSDHGYYQVPKVIES